jgi:hypothetical protein
MTVSDELVTMISSTYIRRKIIIPDLAKRNKEVSALEGTNPRVLNLELRREYHARGACFSP